MRGPDCGRCLIGLCWLAGPPNNSSGCTFPTGEERKPTLHHLKVVRKRMPKYLWPRNNPGCSLNPQSHRFCRKIWAHTATRLKDCSEGCSTFSMKLPPSSHNCHFLHWLNCRPVALVYVCDLRQVWLCIPVAYWGFPERHPVPFCPALSWPCDLRAPVWCSSCPSHCFPGQRCPVRR